MAAMAGSRLQTTTARPCFAYSQRKLTSSATISQVKFGSLLSISSVQPLQQSFAPAALKLNNVVTRAMATESEKNDPSGLPIDLRGIHFVISLFLSTSICPLVWWLTKFSFVTCCSEVKFSWCRTSGKCYRTSCSSLLCSALLAWKTSQMMVILCWVLNIIYKYGSIVCWAGVSSWSTILV